MGAGGNCRAGARGKAAEVAGGWGGKDDFGALGEELRGAGGGLGERGATGLIKRPAQIEGAGGKRAFTAGRGGEGAAAVDRGGGGSIDCPPYGDVAARFERAAGGTEVQRAEHGELGRGEVAGKAQGRAGGEERLPGDGDGIAVHRGAQIDMGGGKGKVGGKRRRQREHRAAGGGELYGIGLDFVILHPAAGEAYRAGPRGKRRAGGRRQHPDGRGLRGGELYQLVGAGQHRLVAAGGAVGAGGVGLQLQKVPMHGNLPGGELSVFIGAVSHKGAVHLNLSGGLGHRERTAVHKEIAVDQELAASDVQVAGDGKVAEDCERLAVQEQRIPQRQHHRAAGGVVGPKGRLLLARGGRLLRGDKAVGRRAGRPNRADPTEQRGREDQCGNGQERAGVNPFERCVHHVLLINFFLYL